MLHLDGTGPDTPRLPLRRFGPLNQVAVSAMAHGIGAAALVVVLGRSMTADLDRSHAAIVDDPCVDVSHIVFVATDPRPGAGGGGGGNRSAAPIRRAESVGTDAMTLRTARAAVPPVTSAPPAVVNDVPLPSIVVDAVPVAAGTFEQVGLPSPSPPAAGSLGPGSGGGVGTGVGTGVGAGRGPGLGRGSGGGTGGGVYQAGGAVSAPRVLLEVRPKYTDSALLRRIQGTVELEVVVTRDGRASQIRVVRSLDPRGLDDEAVAAVKQWRFEPGRLAGTPVDVIVSVVLDFWIR